MKRSKKHAKLIKLLSSILKYNKDIPKHIKPLSNIIKSIQYNKTIIAIQNYIYICVWECLCILHCFYFVSQFFTIYISLYCVIFYYTFLCFTTFPLYFICLTMFYYIWQHFTILPLCFTTYGYILLYLIMFRILYFDMIAIVAFSFVMFHNGFIMFTDFDNGLLYFKMSFYVSQSFYYVWQCFYYML